MCRDVLVGAIKDGVSAMLWREEGFAYADGYDDAKKRYRGLKCGSQFDFVDESAGLVVKSEWVERQRQEDGRPRPEDGRGGETITGGGDEPDPGGSRAGDTASIPPAPVATRFFGSAASDASRVGRDAGRIAVEVISHLSGLVHADVKVTLEIEARLPEGAPENVVRTVTENSRTLKFTASGFEKDP